MKQQQPAISAHLTALLNTQIAASGALGAVVSLRDAAGNWYHLAGGQATPDDQRPPAPQGWFPIFSITKTIVAAACLRLFSERAIALDTPLQRWWPDPRIAPEVTLQTLLNHTSGLPDYGDLQAYHAAVRAAPDQPWTTEQILALAFDQGKWGQIGTWRYANPNYWLLGHILEHESGQCLGDLLREWVFMPAGISELVYPMAAQALQPRYSSYFAGDSAQEIAVTSAYDTRWAGPAGAVLGTAHGIAQLPIALFEGGLLDQQQRTLMLQTNLLPGLPPGVSVGGGMGIYVQETANLGRLVGHGGGGPGCATLVKYSLDRRIGGAVISNSERIDPDQLLYPLLLALAG